MIPGTMAITIPGTTATMDGAILGIMVIMIPSIMGTMDGTIPGAMATMATTTWAIPIIQRFTMAVRPVAIPILAIRVRSTVTVVLMVILPETDQRLRTHIHPV